jgi:hypothetical protein
MMPTKRELTGQTVVIEAVDALTTAGTSRYSELVRQEL